MYEIERETFSTLKNNKTTTFGRPIIAMASIETYLNSNYKSLYKTGTPRRGNNLNDETDPNLADLA